MIDQGAADAVRRGLAADGGVVVITGAGISAASGLRTYRGQGGLWTEEGVSAMNRATAAYFIRYPERSWAWHLARRVAVLAAEPNPAHRAIASMGRTLGDRFTLITQNIDRLHHRAGSDPDRIVEIHGNLVEMRCTGDCPGTLPIPDDFDSWDADDEIGADHHDLLACPTCGMVTRPHVLWFDEFYDERTTGILTAQDAVSTASLCITVGTSGGVPIAERLAGIAARAGAVLIDVNPNENVLRNLAVRSGGHAIAAPATDALPAVADVTAAVTAR